MGDRKAPRVLVVDDHPAVRRAICSLLRRRGYAVESAADGREALGYLALARFDLIITDYQMPRLDGVELWRQASERFPYLRDRFLFCTATPGSAWLPPELGQRRLTKPVGAAELWAAVEVALGEAPPA